MKADLKPAEYLLNYLNVVPGTLEAVYEHIASTGRITLKQCRQDLFFRAEGDSATDHVLEALNFLVATDLLEWDGTEYWAPPGPLKPFAFRALLLQGLSAQTDRQADFMRIYELLVRTGTIGITVDRLMAFLNEQQFKTVGNVSINDLKLGFWMRLLDFIGVLHQVRGAKSVNLTPDCRLMNQILEEAAGGAELVRAGDYLELIECQYFPVVTGTGDLHPGVAAAVVEMNEQGLIGFTAMSDAKPIRFSPTMTASHLLIKEAGADA
ncbi:MAG TPA: hypothetical protein VD969_23405 [Symbiobacteriaceae bacterium]|nr:hypothetical protein [Symbiobacteriaceae bacterium]